MYTFVYTLEVKQKSTTETKASLLINYKVRSAWWILVFTMFLKG